MGWFRSHDGAPTDAKWIVVAKRAGVVPGMVAAVAWAMMDYASQNADRGNVEEFDTETISAFFGWDESQVSAIVKALAEKGVIVGGRLASWEKRQPKREDSSTERVREFRKRNETQCNASERQIREEKIEEIDTPQSPPAGGAPAREIAEKFVSIWREELGGLLEAPRKLTDDRLKACRLRYHAEFGGDFEQWRAHCKAIRGSPFLVGENDRSWRADFDWALRPKSILRVQEGKYGKGQALNGIQAIVGPMVYAEPWAQRLKAFHTSGRWDRGQFGPAPGEPGCRVPAALLGASMPRETRVENNAGQRLK